jgi:hypothetical protein
MAPENMKKLPSKVAHNRPRFFSSIGLAAQTVQKQSRTTKTIQILKTYFLTFLAFFKFLNLNILFQFEFQFIRHEKPPGTSKKTFCYQKMF